MFYRRITFGIEYTYVFKDSPEEFSNAFSRLINFEFIKRGIGSKTFARDDDGAVEINSPPFSSLYQAKKFYDVMYECVSRYPLVAKPEHRVCGGGGHIHMRPPVDDSKKDKLVLYSKLARFLTIHPYIAWMFNEWGDSTTAKNFNEILWDYRNYPRGSFYGMDYDKTVLNKYDTIRKEINPGHPFYCVGGKTFVLRHDDHVPGIKPMTFEFRAFDSKESFRDVEDHINFLNAMVAWVDKQSIIPVSPYNTKGKFLELGEKEKGIEEFRKVIRLLGLPQKRYERFYSNYLARVKHGKLV